MFLYFLFIERLLFIIMLIYDGENDNNERINIIKEFECKYKRINRCLIISN